MLVNPLRDAFLDAAKVQSVIAARLGRYGGVSKVARRGEGVLHGNGLPCSEKERMNGEDTRWR